MKIRHIFALVPAVFGVLVITSTLSHAQHQENDEQRLADILMISDMVEAYYEKNNHYPWVKEPQVEVVNIFISDNIPENYPPSPSHQLLEAELQGTLGPDAILPKDPAYDGIPYQYATDGEKYYVAAYLYDARPYAWQQAEHANKVEVTNSPSLQNRSYRPDYLRHVLRFGPEDVFMQAEFFKVLQEHDFDSAAIMLRNGANPSPTCGFNHRCQPLATAAMIGDLEVMNFLIDNGADLDGYNAYDDVALIYALGNQQRAAAELLVKSGADVNIPNAFGLSPFIGATATGDIELVTLMIESGAELDRNYFLRVSSDNPGDKNSFPLEFAIGYDQPEIVSLLLEAGADPTLRTRSGKTIAEIGGRSENKAIRQLF